MDIRDFCDVAYAYAINSPESRNEIRSGMIGFMFDIPEEPSEDDLSFDGFKKAALSSSMLDELDAFGQ